MISLATVLAGLEPVYDGCTPQTQVSRVVVDSRAVEPGVAFLAVVGESHDGHGFIADAVERGASVVIATRGRSTAVGPAAVWLPDTNVALPTIAANAHGWPGKAMTTLGITGTNGKTTTAFLIGACLSAAGERYARLGTTGNWLVDEEVRGGYTTPFPLEIQGLLARARSKGAGFAVMEVSSHGLDQERTEPLRFSGVALTSFSQDHLDYHPTMEAYLQAKLRLAGHCLDPSGVAVAPLDFDAGRRFIARAKERGARGWGIGEEVRVESARVEASGIRAAIHTPAGAVRLESPMVGRFNLDNLTVAAALCAGVGVPVAAIEEGLASTRGAPGRLQRVRSGTQDEPAVFVDYAHTPDAVARAAATLAQLTRGRLFVVLGCGGDRDPRKRPLMAQAALDHGDWLYATSDNPRTEHPERILDMMLEGIDAERVHRDADRRQSIHAAIGRAGPADTVLIAGKGHEDYQILGTETIHFDDSEVALEALTARTSPPTP